MLPIKIIHLLHQTSLLHVLSKTRLIREPYFRFDPAFTKALAVIHRNPLGMHAVTIPISVYFFIARPM